VTKIGASVIAVAVALALAAAGCGGGESTSSGGVGGTVSFMAFGDPEELQAFRNVIRAFREEEPDVTIKLIEASDRDDLLARLATGFAGGKPPDLFLINYRFFGQFAAKGVLEPLEERLASSQTFSEDDFYEQAVDAFRFRGALHCLPQNISSLVVYYNRTLFQRAGVAEPTADWTWKEMTQKAVALTKDLDGDGKVDQYGLGVEPVLIRLAPFLWSNGAELVNEDVTGFALDTRQAQEVLQEFLSLRTNYRVIPSEQEVESEDDETRFLNGRTAMLFDSRRATPGFRRITAFDWDVAALPRFKEPATILHSDAYCMTKASKNKDATWRFVEFALGPEGQRITAEAGRTVPSLKEVSTSEAFLDPNAKPKNSQVFLDAIEHMRHVPSISVWPEIEDAAEPILEEAMYEEEGFIASEVAARMNARVRALFARVADER
jgi:multiple sugar transport system substrate-binding protein